MKGNNIKRYKQSCRQENIGQKLSPETQSILGVQGWSTANRKYFCLNFSLFTYLKNIFKILGIVVLFYRNNILMVYEIYTVETTGFDRAGHAVETMDAASKAPALLSEDIP